MTTLLHQVRG